MTTFRPSNFSGLTFAAGVGLALLTLPLAGQEPTPPAAEEADAAAADPFAVEDEDRFLLTEPETPEEFLRAALQAQRLARPNLSRLYLQRFLELNPDDDTLLALRDQYGPGAFTRLANQAELQPLSTQLADRVAEVFRRRGASPERIEALLNALGGSPEESFPAREALVNAGETVIPAIIVRLQRETDDFVRQQLLDVLVAMGETALPALHAAAEAPDESLRVQILSVLGRIGSRRSVPHLYFPAYGPDQPVAVRSAARRALADISRLSRVATDVTEPGDVAARLREEAIAAVQQPAPPIDAAADPAVGVRAWSWDRQAGTVRSADLEPQGAALFRGTRFARESFLTAPDRRGAQALYLAFLLGLETHRAGTPEPPAGPGTAFDLALAAGPETAVDILRIALQHEIPHAAVGALAILSQTASPSVVAGDDEVVSDALNHSDPRVQLAAAVTVLRLDPEQPFRNASRVVEILARALSGEAVPTALIIDPSFARGSTIAGFTRQMGYEAVLAATGQEGFTVAAERAHPAFVLVNLNVSRWPLSQTLANFRADARTRDLPVIVFGPAERAWRVPAVALTRYAYYRGPGSNDPRSDVTEYLADIPRTAYVTETATIEAFSAQLRPVLAALAVDPLTQEERTAARAIAAYWLAQIADMGRTDLFPLNAAEPALSAALSDPALASNALIALSAVPTATAQSAIAEVVLAPVSDGKLQRLAAGVLTDHVRRYRLLLPEKTVAGLNALWAKTDDAELRTALATWGGSLRPGAIVTRERLESVPPPSLPNAAP